MPSYKNSQIIRYTVIATSFIIVALILWNTYDFFKKFKTEERSKMEILAGAFERFSINDLDADFSLEDKIIGNNNNIPMIITDEKDSITLWANLNEERVHDHSYLEKQLRIMKTQNEPIKVSHEGIVGAQLIYYRDSDLLTKLKYYPIALILILFLFASVIYLFYKSNTIADQNKLWTGMAKETAHQIGTPLSSLMGWIEILRLDGTPETTVNEIEKDVDRLSVIADRFSKIGSVPNLTKNNIVSVTKNSFLYLESRSSKQVKFEFKSQKPELFVLLNEQLYGWVIENLVKNAIDAMEGKGHITLSIAHKNNLIYITVTDTGKGIPSNLQKQNIFTWIYHKIKRLGIRIVFGKKNYK